MEDELILSMETHHINEIMYKTTKRIFDIIFSLASLIILCIPMIIVGLCIIIKDFGSPLYKQIRIGKDEKKIYIYKFRSMKKNKELTPEQLKEYKREYKLRNDPRLIGYKTNKSNCFGSIIRKTSIDEIPQIIINVLILGNMSIVGPRPLLEEELKSKYTLDEIKKLTSVKPGITGYWQAYARNNEGYENHGRQEMEMYYIDNQSIIFDLKILIKTVETVIKKTGAN